MRISRRMRWGVRVATAAVASVILVTGWLSAQGRPEDLRGAIASRYPGVRWIDVPALARALASAPPPALLDARAAAEYDVSHLRGARRIDPDHPRFESFAELRHRPVVVYCSVGYRSAKIARVLTNAGFSDVKNLEGGIFAWANAGRPVYAAGRVVHRVHPYDAVWGRYLRAELRAPLD